MTPETASAPVIEHRRTRFGTTGQAFAPKGDPGPVLSLQWSCVGGVRVTAVPFGGKTWPVPPAR